MSRFDRLVATYPELRAGRFALLADFENPSHLELFHRAGQSDTSGITPVDADRRTGGGQALRCAVGADADSLVIDNDHAVNWYLKRDWREYDLLLFSVESPRGDARLRIEISAGGSSPAAIALTDWTLFRGHNVVRLDLGDLGEQVALDDIRGITLSVADAAHSINLTFDDFLLTQDREEIWGDRSSVDGSPFVSRRGRRWYVGAGGRFELAFAHGQIIAWFDLTNDPQKLDNLLRGTILGPEWVEVGATAPAPSADANRLASARTRLIEANPVRVVIGVDRRFETLPAESRRTLNDTQWRYTIYPTGQLFVAIRQAGSDKGAETPAALILSARQPASVSSLAATIAPHEGSSRPEIAGGAIGALMRIGERETPLLFVPYFGSGEIDWSHERSDADTLNVMAVPKGSSRIPGDQECAVAYLRLGVGAALDDAHARREASWFSSTARIESVVGQSVPVDDPCSFGSDGLDRASGAYVVAPDQNLVRVHLTDSVQGNPTPVFEIRHTRESKAWVYRGHLLHEPTTLTAQGDLLFQLPPTDQPARTIEVQLTKP